jgi:hypothetical protein
MEVGRPVRILPVIVLSQLAGTSLWFAGNAILPDLQREWGLGERAVGTRLGIFAAKRQAPDARLEDSVSPPR